MAGEPVQLVRGAARVLENDALAVAAGGRCGLGGVLDDLNRAARPASARGRAAAWGFIWDKQDARSARWWPQGITSSADRSSTEQYDGRDVLVTTWYSKKVGGLWKGARITVVDITDPARVRYRHVLLVVAGLTADGRVDLRPVPLHAGGAVWHGPFLHVAGTAKGIYTFCLDDIVPVAGTDRPELLGELPGGGLGGYGHRYVLPLRLVLASSVAEGVPAIRYSFISLTHGSTPRLVAGEYGHGDMTTRLLRYDLDPSTALPCCGPTGVSLPSFLHAGGVPRMQGAVEVEGRWFVTTSAGRRGRGSLWTGEAGRLRRLAATLPPGPEDICYWPATDRLWSLTEYPRARMVLAMDRARLT